jgi:hypothetical protein
VPTVLIMTSSLLVLWLPSCQMCLRFLIYVASSCFRVLLRFYAFTHWPLRYIKRMNLLRFYDHLFWKEKYILFRFASYANIRCIQQKSFVNLYFYCTLKSYLPSWWQQQIKVDFFSAAIKGLSCESFQNFKLIFNWNWTKWT